MKVIGHDNFAFPFFMDKKVAILLCMIATFLSRAFLKVLQEFYVRSGCNSLKILIFLEKPFWIFCAAKKNTSNRVLNS